jgi:3-oxoadipate enol-lactonase
MTDSFTEHDGVRFRYRLDGPIGAPWMVFGNSLATNLTLWDDLVAVFSNRYRILRYDQRGHGETSVPDSPASIEQLADDTERLMAEMSAFDVTFVGVSMGASTGLCIAARPGSRIARLVASDGNAATPPGGAAAWADRLTYARTHGMAAFADLTLPRWFTPGSIESSHPAVGKVRTMIETTPLDGLIACATALQDYDLTARLDSIHVPTLLIAGSHDGVMPASMKAVRDRIAGSVYQEVADAGHLPAIERPSGFIKILERFLP